VSEISGLGSGKITQTYVADPERGRLRITTHVESGRGGSPRTMTRVYDRRN
jgi:hypothetical protein